MVDAEVRQLERRHRESGALDDEVRWLVARQRAGELDSRRVEIAAHCGHAAALQALEASRVANLRGWSELQAWSDGLSALSKEACVLGACALARWLLPRFEKACPRTRAPRRAIEAVEAWVECPCDRHAAKVRALVGSVGRAERQVDGSTYLPGGGIASHGSLMAASAAGAAARAVNEAHPTRGGGQLGLALDLSEAALKRGRRGREEILAVVRDAVVAWALGPAGARPPARGAKKPSSKGRGRSAS